MFRPLTRSHRRAPRRGTVVVITIFALITILMVLGLAFMMYAVKEKAVAQAHKDGANVAGTGAPDPTDTINRFLSTLIYDENDDGDSLNNALRGHSIARSMYGGRRDASSPWAGSTVPWAGVGTFHEDALGYPSSPTAGSNYPLIGALTAGTTRDRARFVNHTVMTVNDRALVIDPEWTGNRFADNATPPVLTPFNTSLTLPGRNYVGKHAGYTYPDLKNFFLGARDPATGEVLVSSFHREWLFGTLAPSNPNWSTATGRLFTLRPTPFNHPNFPRVPPNPDGTYTGDVQNLSGAVGVQKNDSLWMHIGLRPRTLADGRLVQPLVAPLILPLDGLFDLSTHGNQFGTGNAHVSYGGYAPWEINPIYGLTNDAERQALLQYRSPSYPTAFDRYTSGRSLPRYSSVIWPSPASLATPINFTLPTGGSLTGLPSSADPAATPAFGNFRNDNAAVLHPAGYNPNEFAVMSDTVSNSPIFPYTDIKRLSLRYAFTPDWYSLAFVSKPSNSRPTFYGTPGTYPYITNPGATTAHSYRLDPAHRSRLLFNTRSSSLDRPALAPTFSRDEANSLQILAGSTKPAGLFTAPTAYPNPGALGAVTDFAAANQWVSAYAALGSVNLNRPLADYRNNLTQSLSSGNVANANQANLDRQQFAKDIFARLIVALGAAASVDASGNITILATVGTTRYDALRYLAQVAVNLVDYIDNDDVSTVFVWNSSGTLATDMSATEVGNRVVFGVEKPRLVINEAYGEITNDPADPATDTVPLANTKKAHVRFWAELLNPTATPQTSTNEIFGDGSVPLNAYQIQISRANRTFGPTGTLMAPQAGNTSSYLTNNPVHPKYLENTMGVFDPATGNPDVTCRLSALGTPPPSVSPNNATYAPGAANLLTNGVALLRTDPGGTVKGSEFNADPAAAGSIWATSITCPAPDQGNSLGYVIQMPPNVSDLSKPEFKQHVVLLQRLANPYSAFDAVTNPYITVDMMDYVPAFDAVTRAVGQMNQRSARPAMGANGSEYDPPAERFSVGKVQPLAGQSFATVVDGAGKYNQYTFATSMVLNQTAAPSATDPKNTFGRHNGNSATQPSATVSTVNTAVFPATITAPETLMTPFDWLPHMDRPLETLGDVFFARDSRPYRLTTEFVVNTNATPGLVYDSGYGRWRLHEDGLARALELLTVKSPSTYVAHGGRMSGKINVNAMQDRRIALGLWDAPVTATTGNRFNQAFVNNTIWGDLTVPTPLPTWMSSRTPLQLRNTASGATADQVSVPVPNQRADGTPAPSFTDTVSTDGSDRPFLPFGAPSAGAGSFAYGTTTSGTGTEDTILRRNSTGQPILYNIAPSPAINHLHTQTEPFRKVVSNATTVSHAFAVYLTIGYFEIEPSTVPNGWPSNVTPPQRFGAEVYDKIPGDMRQKYVAVVDMSNMALKPNNEPDPHAQEQPFFTALTETARPPANPLTDPAPISFVCQGYDATGTGTLYVAADGQRRPIGATTTLVLGYGTETQVVTVTNSPVVFDPATGIGSVQVTGLARTAWGGTCVSNVRPGYAGPQPTFDFTLPKYKPVVPYVERLK
ncbi:Uncharacterized protein OS=Pirellula staleyi (strain ATCC 27377 / DSM 6068 / ICPB 4128) GN=Psta_0540 PE=4 SV=1 [Gemmata massiliana]|uniref:Uncharacterized protein n=1 Tax=Gemmata massiliana TaxID=1210884 RepID=A0A6P2CS02_9BACT|nr:hypothetical protein [Gemmata massiliana]VTR91126.1 Uncharacterized protein OS=Pirellula staleyi (strain ATCC 27377 / DSM 6068 / ICPB 4128) GN=Psta_0540 PE=4 SV=1 [Gemmata massiliana]